MANFPIFNIIRAEKVYKARKESLGVDFKTLYRFEEHNVAWVTNYFLEESSETRGGAVSPKNQMKIFLRYISDPGFQSGVGEDIGCDQATVSKIVNKAKDNREDRCVIKFPSGAAEISAAKQDWLQRFEMPCTIGVIDCTHVRITKSSINQHGDDYINRKIYRSVNVQATCNSKEWFTSVDASRPGSVHDSRIFKNSVLYRTLQNSSSHGTTVIIGDSAYGSAPWIIVPFKNPATPEELYCNKIYAKDRVIIERCFGQLKRRFPALHYKLRVKIDRIPGMIIACIVLHNISKYLNDSDTFPDLPNEEFFDPVFDVASDAAIRTRGQQLRELIATTLYHNRALIVIFYSFH